MREVTVWAKESTYRARVEPATKRRWFRTVSGYRYVIERIWSKIGSMASVEDWKPCEEGPIRPTREEAERDADAWLDAAEARNPDSETYR